MLILKQKQNMSSIFERTYDDDVVVGVIVRDKVTFGAALADRPTI